MSRAADHHPANGHFGDFHRVFSTRRDASFPIYLLGPHWKRPVKLSIPSKRESRAAWDRQSQPNGR